MGKRIDIEVLRTEREPISKPFIYAKDGSWIGWMVKSTVAVVGAGIFTIVALNGPKDAHAEAPLPGPDDSPERVVGDGEHYLVDELLAQGYTYAEIWADFNRKGFSVEKVNSFNFKNGDVYTPHPDTIRARNERLGIINDLQILTKEHPTIISIMEANNVPFSRLDEVLKLNNETLESATRLPIGRHIRLPEHSAYPTTVLTLDYAGDDYYGDFITLGVAKYAEQILRDNGLTLETVKKQPVGHSILVSGKYMERARLNSDEQTLPATPGTEPTEIPLPLTPPTTESKETPLPNGQVTDATPVQNDSVFLLGDSISFGADELGGIKDVAEKRGLDVTVDAVPGRSLEEAIFDVDIHSIIDNSNLIIELGTNAKESDEVYTKNLREFVNMVRFTAAGLGKEAPKIYILTLYEEDATNHVPDETRNNLIKQVAKELGIEVIDWQAHVEDNPEIYKGGDTVHPSDYRALSDFLIESVAPTESTEQPAETPAPAPQVEADPLTLSDMLSQMREQYSTGKADITWLNVFLAQTLEHPELNAQLGITAENVHRIFKLPNPQKGFDFVVNPKTCVYETVGSAEVFATLVTIQDYANYLIETDERFAYLRGKNVTLQLGDINSPPHNTHDYDRAVDIRSTFTPENAELWPDGPLYMSGAASYDRELNMMVMRFAIQLTLNGELVLEHIITGDSQAEEQVLGRSEQGDSVVEKADHKDHWHLYFNKKFMVPGHIIQIQNFPNDANSCDDPKTGGETQFEQVSPDDVANAPELAIVPEAPTTETPPTTGPVEAPVTEPTTPPVVETPASNPVEAQTPTADSLKMSPEEYIATYNNGVHYKVEMYSGATIDVDPQLQQLVDYIWRVEGGVSPEDAMDAYKVAFAESGHNNTAVNSGGDRCYYQINPTNKKFVESLGIDYDSLQDNPEACVRAALAIFKSAQGKVYSEDIVSKWESRYGLKLPQELRAKAVNGYVSHGWYPWLMSARNSGVL